MAGNKNSGKRKDKQFHTALAMEIAEAESGRDLRAIARNVLETALDREDKNFMAAVNFIADRLDGKPVATVDMNVNDTRTVEELPDSELTSLIRDARSHGTAEAQGSPEKPDSVH